MGEGCRTCASPQREEIDRELVRGEFSFRVLAERFGVTKDTLYRHKSDHLTPAMVKVIRQERAMESARGAVTLTEERLESLLARADRLLDKAEDKNALVAAAALMREARQVMVDLGKMRGDVDESPGIVVNLLSSPEIQTLLSRLLDALAPFPEARVAVAAAIDVQSELVA
jgi:DNA-binding transcriptional ArsR family regulator